MQPSPKVPAILLALLVAGISPVAASAAQLCKTASIVATAPASRFVANADGTVADRGTGLTWKRCAEGQSWDGSNCSGPHLPLVWSQALQLAAATTFAGKNDWRLPNVKELLSIVEFQCTEPAIDLTIFPSTPAAPHWTATPNRDTAGETLTVDFGAAASLPAAHAQAQAVRLVRGPQE